MRLDLPDTNIEWLPNFLPPAIADALFDALLNGIPWRDDHITLYGKTHLLPRRQQWFADGDRHYTYSRIEMAPTPWTPPMEQVRAALIDASGLHFNTCLANLYRDGQDSNGWHSDDEPELGVDPVIASVSLGATRDFRLRHNETRQTHTIALTHGSLLLMGSGSQTHWQHTIPKRKRVSEPRINLTFRRMPPP
jgi:alkylated DNA repair dioxygenase AlkB